MINYNTNRVTELYEVEFVKVYQINNFKEAKLRISELNWDQEELTYEQFHDAIKQGHIKVSIDNDANVTFMNTTLDLTDLNI